MAGNQELNRIDESVLKNLKNYGKRIKEYELSYLVKRDLACSDLELSLSLKKLVDSGKVLVTDKKEYLIIK